MLIANYNPEIFSVLCLEHISEYLLLSLQYHIQYIIQEATDVFHLDDNVGPKPVCQHPFLHSIHIATRLIF